jgi:hypothetical protein
MEIRTEHVPNTSLKLYRYANQNDFNFVLCVTVTSKALRIPPVYYNFKIRICLIQTKRYNTLQETACCGKQKSTPVTTTVRQFNAHHITTNYFLHARF